MNNNSRKKEEKGGFTPTTMSKSAALNLPCEWARQIQTEVPKHKKQKKGDRYGVLSFFGRAGSKVLPIVKTENRLR
jgi:hypothetical protein